MNEIVEFRYWQMVVGIFLITVGVMVVTLIWERIWIHGNDELLRRWQRAMDDAPQRPKDGGEHGD